LPAGTEDNSWTKPWTLGPVDNTTEEF